MKYTGNAAYALLLCLACLFPISQSKAQVSVTTYHNDNARTGLNAQETILIPSYINPIQFGRLFYQTVDGYVFAEPLYVPNLAIPGKGTHNVVFVATEADKVYAFDADHKLDPLWNVSLIDAAHGATPGEQTMSTGGDIPSTQIISGYPFTYSQCVNGVMGPEVGITSTPVIDLSTRKMYVETKSKFVTDPNHVAFFHRLHVLDITTGNELPPGPVVIQGQVTGGAGTIAFDSLHQFNRPGLLLSNGTVYIGFGSHCDWSNYQGWLFAYDASTLTQKALFMSTPSQPNGQAAIWMSGAGPAADASGNVFLATGNGAFDTFLNAQGFPSGYDFGNSILKLALNGSSLSPVDYFTPNNQSTLNSTDQDLGSGGVLLLPDQPGSNPHLMVQVGKEGTIYVINRDQMTIGNHHYFVENRIAQEIQGAFNGYNGNNFYGMPAYWNGSVYFWGINDYLKAYSLSNGLLSTSPTRTAGDLYGSPGDPQGGNMSVSANGTQNGIIWSLSSQYFATLSGSTVLRAHDASSLALLYSSDLQGSRDDAGLAVKFSVPAVANGKVFVGAERQLSIYGLFGPTLAVGVSGTGVGRVVSSPSGIDCGAYCSTMFQSGTSVTLAAAPNTGSTFAGWSGGGCSGTGACTVSLTAATTVTATFNH